MKRRINVKNRLMKNYLPIVFLLALAIAISMTLLEQALKPKYITIEKSSDMPAWELSDKNYPDTATVDTIVFTYGDTAFRTVQYLRIDMKP